MDVRKWHVYFADLNPQQGTEPGKIRPVVVVQTDLLNEFHPSTVVCPLTTRVQAKAGVLRVHLAAGEAGLTRASDIMVDQVRAIDVRRLVRRLGKISRGRQARLTENLRTVLLN